MLSFGTFQMFRQSSLFQSRHGDHICIFYRSENELLEVLTPYVADGIFRGEKCFLAQKPEILRRLVLDLMFLGIDPGKEIERGVLELHTEDEVYFTKGRFEPRIMMDMLIRAIHDARLKGLTAFRSAGELTWASRSAGDCDLVAGYEKMVDEYYPGKPAIGMCQYFMEEYPPHFLQEIVRSHRMHLTEPAPRSHFSSMKVRGDNWMAEVVADKFVLNPRYYYVVERQQPQEVIDWGVARSFEDATSYLDDFYPADLPSPVNESGAAPEDGALG
jgi:hypothetical protein